MLSKINQIETFCCLIYIGGTGAGVPVSISIDGCPGPVCEIRRGSNVNYNVVYNPSE